MTEPVEMTPAEWTLAPLPPGEEPLLRQMFQFYLYDFSEMEHNDIGENGVFLPDPEPYLSRFWSDPDKTALLLRAGGRPVGFTLIEEHSPFPDSRDRRYVAAFFVMRAYRRRGLGAIMAREMFRRWPGRWQVLEVRANPIAQRFWRGAIADAVGGDYAERWLSERELVQEFSNAEGSKWRSEQN
ncbi:MAG: GNAT family N-acetyltransferase [Thermomicrobiales bacterium]|nr:GNAT family N-acetyltransferase [Thermomicrobiales bacterium]